MAKPVNRKVAQTRVTEKGKKTTGGKSDLLKRNISIVSLEISILQKGILDRFASLTGNRIENPDKLFNSNLLNYADLFDSINQKENEDKKGALEQIDITSHKPLAVLFYFSKKSPDGVQAFRRNFIELLYQYAFQTSRDAYLASSNPVSSPTTIKQLENIRGYWECYYDKKGNFAEHLRSYKKAVLGKLAYKISGDNMENATFQFYQSKNFGKGKVSAKRANLFLKSESDSEEQYVSMNCGVNIEDSSTHIEKIVGCFHHIDDAGSPKAGRCVMYYLPEKEWDFENEDDREKFKDNQAFSLEDESDKMLNDIKAYFFEKETNTITANLNVYKDIVGEPRLLEFLKIINS